MSTASRTPRARIEEAARLHRAGDLDGAARLYETALAHDPDDADTRCLLALLRQQQGRAAEAVELIRQAIASRPGVPAYHANLRMAYRALGRPDEASRAFARVRELCPDDLATHLEWGAAIREMGDPAAALAHLRRAVELDPSHAEARARIAALLLEIGRPHEALEHARAAAAFRPEGVEAHLALADTCLALGQPIEARESYRQAVRLEPSDARAAGGLGIAAVRLHLRDEAMTWLRRAVELEPDSVEWLRQLGEAASTFGLQDEVRRCCGRILAIDPAHPAAHNTMGTFAHQEGRRDEAMAHYRRAVELEPRLGTAQFNLGLLHEEMGETGEAEARYRTALRCDPANAMALARLASIHRGALPEDDFQAMHRLLCEPGLSPPHRLKLLFGVADVLDGRGQFPLAAAWLERANALGRDMLSMRGEPYSPDEHRRFIDAIIGAFTPELFDRLAGAGLETTRPVFIIGMPRSGTTLIEQVLASHPRVHGAGEIDLARRSLEEVPEVTHHPGPWPDAVPRLLPPHVAELARRHDRRLREIDAGRADRIIDKRPENYFYLGLVALMFPRATVIHCRRDPRDVALSCWAADFVEVRWAYQREHIAARFSEYRRLMGHWRRALADRIAIHEVDYEETVDDLEGVARRLVAALGLEWHPSCLEFHKTRRPVLSASQNQVRRPLYRSSAGRWKHYEKELAGLFSTVMGSPS